MSSALFFSARFIEQAVNLFPDAAFSHSPVVVINSLPGREMLREHPPLTSGLIQIEDCIDDVPHVVNPHCAAIVGTCGKRLNEFPLAVG